MTNFAVCRGKILITRPNQENCPAHISENLTVRQMENKLELKT